MAQEHVDILDPEIHEPKGVAAASAHQTYHANGAGGGAWKDNLHNVHGDAIIASNATATSTTAAGDATLSTDSDYVKVIAGWSLAHGDGIILNIDELVVPVAGDYFITFWADVKVPLNNNFVGIKYSVNDGTPYSTRKIIAQSTTTQDYLNLAGSGIVATLSALDTISIYVASTKSDSLVIQEAGLVAFLLQAT